MKGSAIAIFCVALLAALPGLGAAAQESAVVADAGAQTGQYTDCRPRPVSGNVELSATARGVLELIASADAAPGQRVPALEQYLATPREDLESVDFVLRNYARLALAGDYLRLGQFDRARALLSQVRLDSPAGARAAVLIARSHQLQGEQSEALRWYVRVAERYPANPRILQNLLDAAATAEEANPRLAAGLYERVLKKALANIDDLTRLKRETEPFSDVLQQYPKDSGTTVGGQVVREIIQSRQQTLPHFRHVLNTSEELTCLEKELQVVKEQMFRVTEQGARIGSFQTMMVRERNAMNERLETLERQLEQAYRSSEKNRIREELEQTRSRLEAMNQRQEELARQRREKTQGPRQARNQLQEREEALRDYLQENRAAIEKELIPVMEALRKQYRDLAGEGQMGKARMMREIAVSDTR